MKRSLAILVFICFALRPAYNVGYFLYYQLNIDYIVNTYCVNRDKPKLECNGKCYLSKQLSNNSDTAPGEALSLTRIIEAFFPLYFEKGSQGDTPAGICDSVAKKWQYLVFIPEAYTRPSTPPPRFA